ncbi:MAM and LDL-receptor class A domain-containing protein 2 [Caerostris extrusa]|uniref:MAM and LDL-receptor class A domain-containing protein 2 n=1 Tax=Caerostris extrusa TaxID=172846 RepID=A0AAV4MUI3_CAEEX|nr:MAM and LDL-receptor class A domain-containing protein 2 [Caerostris extrusa]
MPHILPGIISVPLYKTEFICVYFDSGGQSCRVTEMYVPRLEGDHEKDLGEELRLSLVENPKPDLEWELSEGRESAISTQLPLMIPSFENCYIPRRVKKNLNHVSKMNLCAKTETAYQRSVCDFVDDCGDYSDENRLRAKCDSIQERCDLKALNYCGWTRAPNRLHVADIKNLALDHGQVARMASKVMEATDNSFTNSDSSIPMVQCLIPQNTMNLTQILELWYLHQKE